MEAVAVRLEVVRHLVEGHAVPAKFAVEDSEQRACSAGNETFSDSTGEAGVVDHMKDDRSQTISDLLRVRTCQS